MIHCSEQAAKAFKPAFPARICRYQECFSVLCLDAANTPIGKPFRVAIGTVNQIDLHPRDIFRTAVKRNAVSIIIAHNHPSGRLVPSDEDKAITKRIKQAGELLGIPLLDHLIINSRNQYYSFDDVGEL